MTRKKVSPSSANLDIVKEVDPEGDHVIRSIDADGVPEPVLRDLVLDVGKESDRPDDGEESQPGVPQEQQALDMERLSVPHQVLAVNDGQQVDGDDEDGPVVPLAAPVLPVSQAVLVLNRQVKGVNVR